MTATSGSDDLGKFRGKTLSVQQLLTVFGFRIRNFESVRVVETALEAAGLTTEPLFRKCGLKDPVLITDVGAHAEEYDDIQANSADIENGEDSADDEDSLPGVLPQRPFRVEDLIGDRELVSVTSQHSLSHALTLMREWGFSQMPVIDGTSDLKGAVTWKSLASMREKPHLEENLANAMDREPPSAEIHHELFPRLNDIREHGYLLVRDNCGQLTGIITAADLTTRFHQTALPFYLVGEIEDHLRKCLSRLGADPIRAVQPKNKQTGEIGDLMFSDYIKLLRRDEKSPKLCANADVNWKTLGWPTVDRDLFVDLLDRVRLIRNKIAHFHATPVTDSELDALQRFASMLRPLV